MFHPSIAASYEPQHRLFKRAVSTAFGLAGVFWLVMYGCEWSSVITLEQTQLVRSGQTIIYFVLLTLWGMEYLRETRRLKAVWQIAGEHVCAPQEITSDQILAQASWFGILKPVTFGGGTWLMPVVNLIGLAIAYALIIRQYARLLFMATGIAV